MKGLRKSGILFCTILFLGLCSNKKVHPTTIWKDAIGTICDREGDRVYWICYNVDGKVYKEIVYEGYKTVLNEKYAIHYDIEKPTNFKIDYWHPLFEKSDSTSYLTGKILKIHDPTFFDRSASLTYMFKDGDERIEKWVYLPEDYRKHYPNLKVGQLYNVQVSDENVYRAVIRLDLPIRIVPRKK